MNNAVFLVNLSFLIIFSFTTRIVTCNIRSARFRKQFGDARVSGAISATFDVRTAGECVIRCIRASDCEQYNLGPVDAATQRMTCELLKNDSATGSIAETGWSGYVNSGDIYLTILRAI